MVSKCNTEMPDGYTLNLYTTKTYDPLVTTLYLEKTQKHEPLSVFSIRLSELRPVSGCQKADEASLPPATKERWRGLDRVRINFGIPSAIGVGPSFRTTTEQKSTCRFRSNHQVPEGMGACQSEALRFRNRVRLGFDTLHDPFQGLR
jgi:hypothetical protein